MVELCKKQRRRNAAWVVQGVQGQKQVSESRVFDTNFISQCSYTAMACKAVIKSHYMWYNAHKKFRQSHILTFLSGLKSEMKLS